LADPGGVRPAIDRADQPVRRLYRRARPGETFQRGLSRLPGCYPALVAVPSFQAVDAEHPSRDRQGAENIPLADARGCEASPCSFPLSPLADARGSKASPFALSPFPFPPSLCARVAPLPASRYNTPCPLAFS